MPASPAPEPLSDGALRALLHWYVDMGVEDTVGASPANYFEDFPDPVAGTPPPVAGTLPPATPAPGSATPARAAPRPPASPATPRPTTGIIRPDANALSPEEAIAQAREIAAASPDLATLEANLRSFNGCALKKGARHTVFADGTVGAPLLVMGEAPGRDEDRDGKPFVGRAGHLLDKMLAAIDHDRSRNVYISNVIYWRPPGNRTPTPEEMMICQPFADRLIELAKPKVVMIAGAAPLKALLNKTGIMKTRGKWQTLTTSGGLQVPVMPTFHPAYLLRNPQAKQLVWQDLQMLRARLNA